MYKRNKDWICIADTRIRMMGGILNLLEKNCAESRMARNSQMGWKDEIILNFNLVLRENWFS